MDTGTRKTLGIHQSVDGSGYASAILNILEDVEAEKARLADTQSALLNILDDTADERSRLDATQRAILNILEDSAAEKSQLGDTQRAILNILDDFEQEKNKVEQANGDLRSEVAERARAELALRRANAAAEAANHELEAFSYSVAHDLRAPLRSIDGFSQVLIEDCADKLDEQGRTYLGYVRDSAQQMAQLINDLLALSRVTRSGLSRTRVNMASIGRSILDHMRSDNPDRSVEVVVPEELWVSADERLLKIALGNLLGNAWKFTGKRESARIEIGAQSDGENTVFHVRDNGAGFDMQYANKLFEVFQRLHTVGEFEGTGIGLAIVQRIIRRHGGKIWAEGEVGRGAVFHFTLEEEK